MNHEINDRLPLLLGAKVEPRKPEQPKPIPRYGSLRFDYGQVDRPVEVIAWAGSIGITDGDMAHPSAPSGHWIANPDNVFAGASDSYDEPGCLVVDCKAVDTGATAVFVKKGPRTWELQSPMHELPGRSLDHPPRAGRYPLHNLPAFKPLRIENGCEEGSTFASTGEIVAWHYSRVIDKVVVAVNGRPMSDLAAGEAFQLGDLRIEHVPF